MNASDSERDASDKRSASGYRPDIQGLRAFAVLVVIAFHAGLPMPGGFVGVDVFFVISGFVITAMLHREWARTETVRFRDFYIRRFKRLTPALAVMVSVVVLLSIPLLSPFGTQQVTAATGIGAMFLVANGVISATTGGYFDPAAEINPLLNTWSLSVEEQFYLVFPVLLVLGWRIASRRGVRLRSAPLVVVLIVAVVSFSAAMANASGNVGPRTEFLFGFYGPVSRAWEFAVGAALALMSAQIGRMPQTFGRVLGAAGAAALLASLWLISDATPFPGPWTLLPVLGAAAVIAAGQRSTCGVEKPSGVVRLLGSPPMVTVGDWSYSLYLWHWPLIVFTALLWPGNPLALVIAALVSVGPALISYRWVEQPLRAKKPRPLRLAWWVAVCVLTPSILAGGLWIGSQRYWGLGDLSASARAAQEWESLAEDCIDLSTTKSVATRVGPEGCRWNASGTASPVYLVGDSAAAQFLAGVRDAADRGGHPLQLIAAAHCPLSTANRVNEVTGPATDKACSTHNATALRELAESPPGTVFLAVSNRYWYVDDDRFTTDPVLRNVNTASGRRLLEQSLIEVIGDLRQAGHRVVFITPTMTFLGGQLQTPERMPLFRLRERGEGSSPLGMERQSLEPGQEAARAAAARIASKSGATSLDLVGWQCPDGRCPAFQGDTLMYADSAHLSQEATRLLTDRFVQLIREPAPAD